MKDEDVTQSGQISRERCHMPRTVKSAEERRLEIIQTSERLFRENGYASTSVDAIIKEMGVAKGTFYYYFKSKEEVLAAIVDHTLDQIVAMAEQVAADPSLDALAKMRMLLSNSHMGDENTEEVTELLHMPSNRELHEVTNIQTVLRLAPIFAKIVEQGNQEGVFRAARPTGDHAISPHRSPVPAGRWTVRV
jgi:AcrR family transcriptional regulator